MERHVSGDDVEETATRSPILHIGAVLLDQWKRVVVIAGSVLVLFVAAALLKGRAYTSKAAFVPELTTDASRSGLATLAGQFGINVGTAGTLQSPAFYAEVLRSRAILSELANSQYVVPNGDPTSAEADSGTIADLIEVDDEDPSIRTQAAIDWLDGAMAVVVSTETDILTLAVTTYSPALSQQIGVKALDFLNHFNVSSRQARAAAERRFVEGRETEAANKLHAAEAEMKTFLENNREFRQSPDLTFQYERLQRRLAMQQEVYTSLAKAHEEARINEVRNTPVITVMDHPSLPAGPDSRHLLFVLVTGAVVGGFVGAAVALFADARLRVKNRDPDGYRAFAAAWNEAKRDLLALIGRS